MSPFTPKDWKNDPDDSTPLNEAALEDLEVRVTDYTDDELAAHTGDTTAAHAASAISFSATGTITSTNAQAAIAEVATDAASALTSGLAGKASSSHTHTVADLGTGTPASGKYLDGAGAWTTLPSASGSGLPVNVLSKTSNFTAAAGDLVLCNATSAGFTITLPASPSAGNLVTVIKTDSSSNIVTVAGTVNGDAGGAEFSAQDYGAIFEYVGSGWRTVAVTNETTGTVVSNSGTPLATLDITTDAVTIRTALGLSSLYQPLDSDLTSIAALTTTSFGRALLALADAAAGRTALGLGTAATQASGAFEAAGGIAAHEADTTSVHGIADTSALLTKTVTVNTQTGTSYTLVSGDAAKLVTVSNATTHTLTVPPNSSVAFPVGTVVNVARIGAGAVNVAGGVGVTVSAPGGVLGLRAQYSQATLIKIATDTWLLGGDIA